MSPKKSKKTTAKESYKPTSLVTAPGFFQKVTRTRYNLRQRHLPENQEITRKRERTVEPCISTVRKLRKKHATEMVAASSSATTMKSAFTATEKSQEKPLSITTNLQEKRNELERAILAKVAKRSDTETTSLAALDLEIWETILQWELIGNRINSQNKRTGMIWEHQRIVSDIVIANGMVSWYRPINLEAENWLAKGAQGKALLTKGKSSSFDYIAGLIPIDVRLSKLMHNPNQYDPTLISYYQSNINIVLEIYSAKKTTTEIEHEYHEPEIVAKIELAKTSVLELEAQIDQPISFDQLAQYQKYVETANELPKHIAVNYTIQATDGQEYTVHYVVNPNTKIQDQECFPSESRRPDIVFNSENNQPILIIKKDHQYLTYNPKTRTFDIPYSLPKELDVQPLQVMAYQQFELDEHRVVHLKKPRLVTADYDEGASVALRIHPFMQRTEMATDSFALLHLTQSHNELTTTPEQAIEEYALETMARHETRRNMEARDIAAHGTMGRANDEQRALLSHLRDETGWVINHGAEANSPDPQPFEEHGTYPCFYPDGRVELLEGSEEYVCRFINEQRVLGFPLAVNPKWDWKKDPETGLLFVPAERGKFDWQAVDQYLKKEQQKVDAVHQKYKQRGETEYADFLNFVSQNLYAPIELSDERTQDRSLIGGLCLAKEIVDLILHVESLRVEPNLTYPGLIESYKYRVLSKEDKELYQERIKKLIEQFHSDPQNTSMSTRSTILQIVDYYDTMGKKLKELERTTPEYQSRQQYDEVVKERLADDQNEKIQKMFQKLKDKTEKHANLRRINPKIGALSTLKKKITELSETFEPSIPVDINFKNMST